MDIPSEVVNNPDVRVKCVNHCEILCDPNTCSYSFSDYSMSHIYVVVKEYERV